MTINPPIQPACPKCEVELRADGTCPYCDPRAVEGDEDEDVSLTAEEFTAALAMCLSPDDSEEGLDLLMGAMQDGGPAGRFEIRTFADACLMTRDSGLVIRLGRSEFHITVVRSR